MKLFDLSSIILEKVKIGGQNFSIPVADLKSEKDGPTILITGGVDGDEHTGIKTCYELIEKYKNEKFIGRIIIIPILNISGFEKSLSANPLDDKFPKYIYPGKENGTSSEELVNWLNKKYILLSDLWIDLHSGSINEKLNPFVWGFETKNLDVNKLSLDIFGNIDAEIKIYEKSIFGSKSYKLSKKNIAYLIFEVGQKGSVSKQDVLKMVSWVDVSLNTVWLSNKKKKNNNYYRKVDFYKSKIDGFWEPDIDFSNKDHKKFGSVFSIDRKKEKILMGTSGRVLWYKDFSFVRKNEFLVAVAKQL